MAGITAQGFEKKDFNDILEEMISKAQNLFGDDIDLRDETFMKQWLVVMSLYEAERWNVLEDIYNNYAVTQATDISLDYAVKFQGLRRKEASKSTVDVTFTGDDGVTINSGFIVQTENEVKFKTVRSDSISGANVTIECEALVAGAESNVISGTIKEVESPLAGLTSITNLSDATGGSNKETDDSLRARFLESLARGGGSTTNAIRAAILSLENIQDVLVFETYTENTVDGLPPKSFNAYILDGTTEDIQDAIYTVKAAGIQAFGSITKDYTDHNGNEITIGIDRPTDVDVWVNATITGDTDYPADGDTQVENAILDYFDNLDIGQDVLVFGLSNYIANNVDGILNIVIETSTDGSIYTPSDVTINRTLATGVEVAQTESAKIAVI